MKKFLSIILAFATTLSLLTTVVSASSADNVELTSIDYLLKKGDRTVNITQLSNKMEVVAKVKNNSGKSIYLRVDGYKNNKLVSGQSVRTTESSNQDAEFIIPLSGNIKTNCDKITVNVVSADHSEKKLAVFPAISLGIIVNGKEITGYSDDVDEYDICLNTPYPYFDVQSRGSMQKDIDQGINYKMPYTRTVKATQVGKDDDHRIERTVKLNFTTTNPAPAHISNDNMIFWVQKDNNIDQFVYDRTTTKWSDISGYKNSIDKVNGVWTNGGMKSSTKWNKDELTELPQKVVNAVNSGSFTLKFKINELNQVAGSNLSVIGSDNENFRIYSPKETNKLYFKWAGARFTPLMVSVNSSEAIGKENTITVDNATGDVTWYIDGVKKSEKTYATDIKNSISKLTLSDVKVGNAGSVVFDEIKVFDKALTNSEVASSDIINADTSMSTWYNSVDTAIALCGDIKNAAKTPSEILGAATTDINDDITDTNIKYFCRNFDSFAKDNASAIVSSVSNKITASNVNADFLSYSDIADLTEESILSLKSKNGVKLSKDEVKSYIRNSCREDIAELMDDINEGAIDGVVDKINASKTSSDAEFADNVEKQLIITAINNPKDYNWEEVSQKIIRYSSDLGLNLNGYDKLNANKRAEIAQKLVNAKPSTVREMENILVNAMNKAPEGNTTPGGTNSSSGGGGLSSAPTNIVQDIQDVITEIAGFNDMQGSEWVEPALKYMVENNYVSGVAEGKFAPKNHITRAEFVAIISRCEGFDTEQEFEDVFNDVKPDFWGYKNVMSAYNLGIISGIDEYTFNPNGNITRQDIAVILYNVYKLHKEYDETDNGFADWETVSDYAKDAVGKLHSLKILNGYGENFEPKGLCTRAEAVQAIYGYLQAVNR